MAEVLFNFKVLLPVLMAISRAYVESKGIGTPGRSILMPVIIWDARNPLFNCPSRGINTIYVHMTDYVNFACPIVNRNLEWYSSVTISYEKMYENGWLLTDEAAALKCDASAQTGSPFINCNDPTKNVGARSIRISIYSEAPGDPQFRYGTTYYLIGTGNGTKSGLVKKVGGRCSGYSDGTEILYNLTLRLHVCSKADEYTERCPRCFDSACYSKGCGIYGPWQAPTYQRNISNLWLNDIASTVIQDSTVQAENKCYNVSERVCDDASRGCTGPNREIKKVKCPKVYVSSTGDCSGWKTKQEIYRNETNGCYQINYRECIVGSLERYNKTEWRMVKTICPTTAAPPTTPTPKKICQPWKDVNGLYRNSSGSCFMLQERECQLCKTMPNITERHLTERNCPPPLTTMIPKPSPSSVAMSTLKRTCNGSTSVVVQTVVKNSTVTKTSRLYIEKTLVVTVSRSQSIKQCGATTVMPCPSPSQNPQTKTVFSCPTPTKVSSTNSPKSTTKGKSNGCPPNIAKQTGEDEQSYVIYVVALVAFGAGGSLAIVVKISCKRWKARQSRVHLEKYCSQNGHDTESNHTADTDVPYAKENRSYELDSLKRKSTIALTKPA